MQMVYDLPTGGMRPQKGLGFMGNETSVVIAGATGFIGQELGIQLSRRGYELTVLTRDPRKYEGRLAFPCKLLAFGPENNEIENESIAKALSGAAAVINLAGQSVDTGSWKLSGKKSIYESRLIVARALSTAIRNVSKPPKMFLQASATGYYGNTDDLCSEDHAADSTSFLSKVCFDLEAEGKKVELVGTRYLAMRIGVVLGHGGALEKINQLYAAGVGARFFGAKGYFPWVSIDDVVSSFVFMLEHADAKNISGPVNIVGPETADLKALHDSMVKVHGTQLAPPAPAWIVRKVAAKRAVLLFDSARVAPTKLLAAGFKFSVTSIGQAIERLFFADRKGQFRLVKKQFVRADMTQIWKFFSLPQNLESITPPWLRFKIKKLSTETMGNGTTILYQLRLKGFPVTWKSLISGYEEKKQFRDEQLIGPYRVWEHTHRFEPLGDGILIIDDIVYSLPLGKIGTMIASWYVQKDVGQIFSYRADVVAKTLNISKTVH
jgi:uncharacterized protein (TIGR01777 family)